MPRYVHFVQEADEKKGKKEETVDRAINLAGKRNHPFQPFSSPRTKRRRNLWTSSPGIMARTMKADSPSPRFHGVTPCSPGLITFGLKSLICCRKAGDEAFYPRFDKIFPRCAFRPCRKTFKKIIFRRGKVDGRGLFDPTNLKNSQPGVKFYFLFR